MEDFRFLTREELDKLEILKKYGLEAAVTDFSNRTDCSRAHGDSDNDFTSEGYSPRDLIGPWWLGSESSFDRKKYIWYGERTREEQSTNIGARPAISYSSISSNCLNKLRGKDGILEVEYGEYPQWVASPEISWVLEKLYSTNNEEIKSKFLPLGLYSGGKLIQTGKNYTTGHYDRSSESLKLRNHIEYEYNGKKYIRMPASFGYDMGKAVWVEVSPIRWLVDEETNVALSKNILFGGVPFNILKNNYTKFDETTIKKFMDDHFGKEIIPSHLRKTDSEKLDQEVEQLEKSENFAKKKEKNGIEFTLLSNLCIDGLELFKLYGDKGKATDFEILLGGYETWITSTTGLTAKSKYGPYRINTLHAVYDDYTVISEPFSAVNRRNCGVRPSMSYSSISSKCTNREILRTGFLTVEYGEYPQSLVSEDIAIKLEVAYKDGLINRTGKSYTTDSDPYESEEPNPSFKARNHIEYEYNGKKYIRIIGSDNSYYRFTNGKRVEPFKPYWIEVEPIKWLVDERADIAISESCLFAGIQFSNQDEREVTFDESDIKKFIDEYFSKDIIPSLSRKITAEDTKVEERKKVLEELKKELLQQPMEDLNQQEKFNR